MVGLNIACIFSYKKMVEKFNVEYIPGGATQNSIRVAQVSVFTAHSSELCTVIGKIIFKFSFKEIKNNLVR